MPREEIKVNRPKGACLSDDLLYRHLEKMTTPEEEARIELHLNSCHQCFTDVIALTDILQTPISETERLEIAQSRQVSPEEQVKRILDFIPEPATNRPASIPPEKAVQILIVLWHWYRRHAISVMASLLLGIGIFASILYFRGNQNAAALARVENELKTHHKTYVNLNFFDKSMPRLSGDYEHDPTFRMESDTVLLRLQKSLQFHQQSTKAKQLLAQTFIMEGAYLQADSMLRQIPIATLKDASLFNDQGVCYLALDNLPAAEQAFREALIVDSNFKAARYNLALTKARMGATTEAVAELRQYYAIEKDEGWRVVISFILEDINKKQ